MLFTEEHARLRETLRGFIEKEINPNVDAWEEAEIFPAHEVFKKMGDLGLLGITKPVEFGGLGLDFSYAVAFAEELGRKLVLNIVMVGFFAGVTDILSPKAMEKAVLDSVPRGTEDLNLRAFKKGFEHGQSLLNA